jgi:hypothetical protein
MRRTKVTLIYRQTRNLRALQLLLGHSKMESTVRYLGIEVDDTLEIAEYRRLEVCERFRTSDFIHQRTRAAEVALCFETGSGHFPGVNRGQTICVSRPSSLAKILRLEINQLSSHIGSQSFVT